MSISFATEGSDAHDVAFGSGSYSTTSVSFAAGDYFLFVFNDNSAGAPLGSVSINGVSGTKVAQPNVNTDRTLWKCLSVPAGTGNVTINTSSGALAVIAMAWVGVAGEDATSFVYTNDVAGNHSDPQNCSGIVPAGGAGIAFIGSQTGPTGNPTTWTGVTRSSALESSVTTGNTGAVAGGTTLTAGTLTAGATGASGNGWGYPGNLSEMIMVTMGPSGGGGGGSTDDRAFESGAIAVAIIF